MESQSLTVRARAALPDAIRQVIEVWTPAAVALGDDDADPLRVIRTFTAARAAIADAERDLLLVAVLAGARPTPSAVRCGYSASTLRRHLRALTETAA